MGVLAEPTCDAVRSVDGRPHARPHAFSPHDTAKSHVFHVMHTPYYDYELFL